MAWWQALMDDNGAYLLLAYGIVIATVVGYTWRLHSRWQTALRSSDGQNRR